jgi:hypothetical protein
MLQELIANALKITVGNYSVMTVNAHVYPDLVPNFNELIETRNAYYPEGYSQRDEHTPILGFGENYLDFLDLCGDFVKERVSVGNKFLRGTAMPMRDIYLVRKDGAATTEEAMSMCEDIADKRWRIACIEWLQRKL